MIKIRPATLEDMAAVDGIPPGRTVRGVAVEEDGQTIAVGGFFPMNTRYMVFSNLTPRILKNKRALVLGVRALQRMIASRTPLPCIAVADEDIPGSEVLLQHMGFKHHHGRVYEWRG